MPGDLLDSFGAHVDRWEVVAVAVPLMLLAAVATHITARGSLRQQRAQEAPEPGTQAAQMAGFMRLTPWIFPLGVIVGGLFFTFPIAILLYWLTNNGWTMVQQHLVHRSLDAQEARDAEARSASQLEAAVRPGTRPLPGAKPAAEGRPAGRRTPGQASEAAASKGGAAGGSPGNGGRAAGGGPAGSAGTAAGSGEPAAARGGPNGVAESAAAARRGGPAARRAGTSGKAAAGRRRPGTRKGGRR
jgi:YidC/Oxa1 family membrane protein insertase